MYEKLLEAGTIGRMNLRNRIVMSPTETHFTASDGMLTWPEIDYYARRAKGGVGLIITQQTQACAQLDPIDPYPRKQSTCREQRSRSCSHPAAAHRPWALPMRPAAPASMSP